MKISHPGIIGKSLFIITSFFSIATHAEQVATDPVSSVNITVLDIDKTPLPDVVVYLEPLVSNTDLPFNDVTLEVNQKDKAFVPYISVMQQGNKVNFKNNDDITHHIYSPVGENKFSFKIKASEEKVIETIAETGEIAMGCNIHDWMSGYILVVDTPYFAKTNANGIAVFPNTIKGDYQLNVWHPQMVSDNNKQIQRLVVDKSAEVIVKLNNDIDSVPVQKSEEDFEFLSDY